MDDMQVKWRQAEITVISILIYAYLLMQVFFTNLKVV